MNGNSTGSLLRHSRLRRHRTYVGSGFRFDCHPFGDFYKDHDEACRYVKTIDMCDIIVNFVDYLDYMICDFHLHDDALWMILCSLIIVGFYCFLLYVTVKYFIVPNILTMAHNTRMSGYTYGFIIISAIIVVPFCIEISLTCKAQFAFSALLVADWMSVILPILTAGFIVIASPREVTFRVRPRLFCFNIFMVVFGMVTVLHVLSPDSLGKHSTNEYFYTILLTTVYFGYIIFLWRNQSRAKPKNPKRPSINSDEYEVPSSQININGDPWTVFLQTISPYRNNIGNFYYILIISPIWFALSFFVPVVTKSRHLNGWCKSLTIINFLIFPLLFYSSPSEKLFYSVVIFSLLAVIVIGASTYVHRIPPCHKYLALFGTIAGVYVFVLIDNELNCIFWQVLNFMVDWRADAVFLVSPVANLLTVAVLVQALVDNGFTEMAYGTVFGIISITIYTAYPLIVLNFCFAREHMTPVTSNIQTTYYFLLITLGIIFFSVSAANFQIRKSHSYYLCIMYAIYYIYIFLSAVQFIHPLGSQHSINYESVSLHADWA